MGDEIDPDTNYVHTHKRLLNAYVAGQSLEESTNQYRLPSSQGGGVYIFYPHARCLGVNPSVVVTFTMLKLILQSNANAMSIGPLDTTCVPIRYPDDTFDLDVGAAAFEFHHE